MKSISYGSAPSTRVFCSTYARRVILLIVMFASYFLMAKPVSASGPITHTLAFSHVHTPPASGSMTRGLPQDFSEQGDRNFASLPNVDDETPSPCSDSGESESSELEMDELVAPIARTHFFALIRTPYAREDWRLKLPTFDRSLDYPPATLG
jgi:hypothetical protein